MSKNKKHEKMVTISTKIEDLKKGDNVAFYGEIFEVTENAKNFGSNEYNEITNTIADVWGAPCKIISQTDKTIVGSLLFNYDWFQGNGNPGANVSVIKK